MNSKAYVCVKKLMTVRSFTIGMPAIRPIYMGVNTGSTQECGLPSSALTAVRQGSKALRTRAGNPLTARR